jgi:hypothetical protein
MSWCDASVDAKKDCTGGVNAIAEIGEFDVFFCDGPMGNGMSEALNCGWVVGIRSVEDESLKRRVGAQSVDD